MAKYQNVYTTPMGTDDEGGYNDYSAALKKVTKATKATTAQNKSIQAPGYTPSSATGDTAEPVNVKPAAAPVVSSSPSYSTSYSGTSSYTAPAAGPGPVAQTPVQARDDGKYNELLDYIDELKSLYTTKSDEQQRYIDELLSQRNQYSDALKAQQEANDLGVKQAVNTIENQKAATNQSYADTLRQLYLNKMQGQKNIGQQMAAVGQTGGQAESTLLGLETNYSDALRQSEIAKAAALNDLETSIANAQLSGSQANAQAIADNAREKIGNYTNVLQNLLSNEQANRSGYAGVLSGLISQEQAERDNNRSYAYQTAMGMLQAGQMPTTELLDSAGISTADAETIVNAYNAAVAAQAAGRSSGGSGSESGESTSKLTKDQAKTLLMSALKQGSVTPETKAMLEEYYGTSIEDLAYANDYYPPTIKTESAKSPAKTTGTTGTTGQKLYISGKQDIVNAKTGTSAANTIGDVALGTAATYAKDGKTAALQYINDAYKAGLMPYTVKASLEEQYKKKG